MPKTNSMKTASKARYLCSELVRVEGQDVTGAVRVDAVLEEIWTGGACIHCLRPTASGAKVWIVTRQAVFSGAVAGCHFGEDGYFWRVAFDAESRWSPRKYRPEHLVATEAVLVQWLKRHYAGAETPMVRTAGGA